MRSFFIGLAALQLMLAAAAAQTNTVQSASSARSLSMDQQNKISESITEKSTRPLTNINFTLAIDTIVPQEVTLQPLPPEAESAAPQLHGYSFIAVEELVAIVDTDSRQIVTVMQRLRPQESTGSGR